jgi:hypothetical protein
MANRDFTSGKAFLDTGYKPGQERVSSKGSKRSEKIYNTSRSNLQRKTIKSNDNVIRSSTDSRSNSRSKKQALRSSTDVVKKMDKIQHKSNFVRQTLGTADQNAETLQRETHKSGQRINGEHVSIPISNSKLQEYKKLSLKVLGM